MHRLRHLISLFVSCAALVGFLAGPVTAGASADAVQNSGTLTVVQVGTWSSLDPANPTIVTQFAEQIPAFDPLFFQTNSGALEPGLALGYHVSNGGLTIAIKLRHGVKFQDGTPFNASAVAFNLKRYASPTVASECVAYLSVMSSVVPVGADTVVITLSQPDTGFIFLFSSTQCALMASPTAVQSEGANFGVDPVGTGPFRYAGGNPTTSADFIRNNSYWGGKPRLAAVDFAEVGSNATAYDEMETGEAQFWPEADGIDYLGQAGSSGLFTIQKGPAVSINYITFSFTHPPFNNPIAREAVFYATNTRAIIASLEDNLAKPIEGIFPPTDFAYDGNVKGYPTYNLAKAQQLVNEIPGGLSFTANFPSSPTSVTLCDALVAMWNSAGMHAQCNPLATPAFVAAIHNRSFDVTNGANPPLPDPDLVAYRWFYSTSPLSQNGLSSPVADRYILKARDSAKISTRKALYDKLDTYLENQQFVWDDLYLSPEWSFQLKDLHGVTFSSYYQFHWGDFYFSKR